MMEWEWGELCLEKAQVVSRENRIDEGGREVRVRGDGCIVCF